MTDETPDEAPANFAVRAGRHSRIRPIRPPDYEWAYELASYSPAGSRWRLHGDVPNFEQFVQILFQSARATMVVESLETGRRLGLTQLWNLEPVGGTGHLSAFIDPRFSSDGWPLEGIALFIAYVFEAFNLRKLYLETLATELGQFRSMVGTLMEEEGRLLGHRYVFGEYVDCHIFAMYREPALEAARRLLPSARSVFDPALLSGE